MANSTIGGLTAGGYAKRAKKLRAKSASAATKTTRGVSRGLGKAKKDTKKTEPVFGRKTTAAQKRLRDLQDRRKRLRDRDRTKKS